MTKSSMGHGALEVGIVCGRCETFSLMGEARCTACGHDLSLFSAERPSTRPSIVPVPVPLPVLIEKARSHSGQIRGVSGLKADRESGPPVESQEEQMDQARYYVCESCMTPVPSGHKFCGRCGAPVPDTILHMAPSFYSDMQDGAKARLILIRGEGMDGLSYHLKADQHVLGRQGQLEFPDDPFISPKHANFFYRDNRLVVRDEGSLNGDRKSTRLNSSHEVPSRMPSSA